MRRRRCRRTPEVQNERRHRLTLSYPILMAEILTKAGQLRRGFEYQDAYAIFLIAEWLEHPERVKWMKVEADEFGFLDNVVVMRADGTLRLVQVKFSVLPDTPADAWGWEHLLKKGRRGSSLIQKWFNSWSQAVEEFCCEATGVPVTNR